MAWGVRPNGQHHFWHEVGFAFQLYKLSGLYESMRNKQIIAMGPEWLLFVTLYLLLLPRATAVKRAPPHKSKHCTHLGDISKDD